MTYRLTLEKQHVRQNLREGIPGRTNSQDDNRISGSGHIPLSLKPIYKAGKRKLWTKKFWCWILTAH